MGRPGRGPSAILAAVTGRHEFAVFFDVGETLVNETRLWSRWADALGVPYLTFFGALGALAARGEPHTRVFELVAPGVDPATLGVDDGFRREDLYPDARPCLAAIRAAGDLVGLAGNQASRTEALLPELGLEADVVASSETWGVEKPSPRFFERIREAADLPAGRIAYVGDRVDNDVVPAADAGMVAVFLRRGPWGIAHAEWPQAARAALTLDSLLDLPEALAPYRER
jgi:FMN phosphatase YigB (HAD superfamily)